MTSSDDWIYHERQEAMLCGQHALNNLVQAPAFSAGYLADIAHELDALELTFMSENNEGGVHSKEYVSRLNEGSGNVDAQGNFSIQVLAAALERIYGLSLPSIGQADLPNNKDITSYEGFICNKSAHWFAIRKIGPHFWNLNSLLDQPESISHFRLAAELEGLQHDGYSVFVIPGTLPPGDKDGTPSTMIKFWWRRSALERGQTGATGNAGPADWNSAGTGRRLDGKSSTTSVSSTSSYSTEQQPIMSEDEQLQRALEASILPDVPEEPAVDADDVVTIQFRFPNGKRVVRRFDAKQPSRVIYAFCQRENGGGDIELKVGFPPKTLDHYADTIGTLKLNGENIQVRNAHT